MKFPGGLAFVNLRVVHFGLILSAIFLSSCDRKGIPTPPTLPSVTVMIVQSQTVPVTLQYVAQTQSSRLVNIYSRVSGFLERRVYTEGEMVKEGTVLFLIDARPFKVQLAQAEAALARQEAALTVSKSNLARTKPLTAQDALSQKDLDDAIAQFESASAAVEQAKAQVEAAKLNLSYCTITSPCDGITSAALQQDGTYISLQNSKLTTVMVLSPIWVNFSISENEMQRFRNQAMKGLFLPPEHDDYVVEIVLVDGSVYPYTGRLTFAEPTYNSQSGTFLVRASVDNPEGILRPNQYVHVRLKGAVRPNAILVPQRAVQMGAKGHYVWVVGKDDTVNLRPVVVGEWYGDDWFIEDGLKAGERVVVEGGMALHPAAKVAVSLHETDANRREAEMETMRDTAEAAENRVDS